MLKELAYARLQAYQNKKEPTPEEIEKALAAEEMIIIHHNYEFINAINNDR